MQNNEQKYLFLIFIIFIAACIETDIYLPAFCDMMHYFSASEEMIQSVLTWNFIGICISGPFYGPISDSIGRKKPLIVALGLFFIGSILTIIATTFTPMLIGRLLQGLGSGGCFTLGTAIIFDAFQGEKATRAINKLNSIVPFVMAAAPIVGGYLNLAYGFRANFIAIALFVLASLIICLFLYKETLPKEKMAPLQAKKLLSDFKTVSTHIPFWQLTVVVSLIFAGYLTFLSETAVLFVTEFGVSKTIFPLFQAAILAAWVIANLLFTPLLNRMGKTTVKRAGSALVLLGGICFALTSCFTPQNPTLLTLGMLIYTFGANWINGIYFPEVMELLPDYKGVTSSLLTSARLLLTAFVIGTTSIFYDGTIYPILCAIAAVIAIITPLIAFYEKKSRQLKPQNLI
jgi:DHA1 family bicyclomycin/chloramphenicol resistance-like MFS transporter